MSRQDQFVICPVTAAEDGEAGYMLVAVVVMVALVLIALSVAAPIISKQIRRDKEVETEHRAQQYVRAIRLYYRKFHAYPASIDALKQTSNIRFLRQEYADPLTGKNDWRIIHLGEQKTTVKGFFGQEIGGISSGGMGSNMGSGLGSASGLSSGFGAPVGSSGASGSTGPTSVSPGAGSTIGTTTGLAGGFLGATIGGASGATGSTGGTGGLGGGVIVGIGPGSTGDSILTPNQQTTYQTWEFWYDPRIEQMYQKGQMNIGGGGGALGSQPASSFGTGINGQPNGNSGLGIGTGSGFGSAFGSTGSTGSTTPTGNSNTGATGSTGPQ